MKITSKSMTYLLVLAVITMLVAWLMLRKWQGPELVAYRIQNQPLVQTVVATGRVTSASRAQVGAEIAGVVIERRVQEGDKVQAGDILAVLRDNELQAHVGEAQAVLDELRESNKPQAEAALSSATARFEQARREVQRRQDLFGRKLIASEALEQAIEQEAVALAALEQAKLVVAALAIGNPTEMVAKERLAVARANLAKTLVRAQVDGTVLTRQVEPGDVVQAGRVLFEIARDGQTELLVPVDERNLSVLRLGQTAVCVTDAYPEKPFSATVNFIAPAVDPQRGSVDIRLKLNEDAEFLRQDMTVTVNIETARREHALVIPNDVLNDVKDGQAMVWKVENGRVQRNQVTLGLRGLALSEITAGLSNGDLIVADIGADWVDGSRVRIRDKVLPNSLIDASTAGEIPVKFD